MDTQLNYMNQIIVAIAKKAASSFSIRCHLKGVSSSKQAAVVDYTVKGIS